jgi:uncharacterized protein
VSSAGMGRRMGAALGLLVLLSATADAAAADLDSAKAAYQSGDYRAAFAEFQDLANGGDTEAIVWVGFLYEQGQGTTRDYDEAMRRFRMAADLGDGQADFYVGDMYANGYGVAKDAIEAVALVSPICRSWRRLRPVCPRPSP